MLSDSVIKRYHEKVNQKQNRAPDTLNFYDEAAEIHRDSSELIGDYVCRAIDLVGYVVGPMFRLSVKLGEETRDREIMARGLPR